MMAKRVAVVAALASGLSAMASASLAATYLDFEGIAMGGDQAQIMDAQTCGQIAAAAMSLYPQVRGMMEQLHIPFTTALSQARFNPAEISADDIKIVSAWTKNEIVLDQLAGTPMLQGTWDNGTMAWTLCFNDAFGHADTAAGKAAWDWSQRMFQSRGSAAKARQARAN